MSALPVTNERELTRTEWLQARKSSIGGSEVAAILGLSPWVSRLDVYFDKTNDEIVDKDSSAMEWGRRLEPVILQKYSDETGREVFKHAGFLRHQKHPFMTASLDGYTKDHRGVEAKTAGSDFGWGGHLSGEIPPYYALQVQHYMGITGFPVFDVPVLFGARDYRQFEVGADAELIGMIAEACCDFWAAVEAREMPDPVTEDDVKRIYAVASGGSIQASADILASITELKAVKAYIKEYEERKKALELEVKLYMGECSTLLAKDATIATWNNAKGATRFDSKRFEIENPDLYTEYVYEDEPTRRLLLKSPKK